MRPVITPNNRHKHLIVKADILHPPSPDDCQKVEAWITTLVKNIHMKILLGPYSVYCHVEGNAGLTAIAAIETSHIALHIWDLPDGTGIMEFDVYTCSDLNVEEVFKELEVFGTANAQYKFLDREFDLMEVKNGKMINGKLVTKTNYINLTKLMFLNLFAKFKRVFA